MTDYNAGIQSFKQQFGLIPSSEEEDYSAEIESFKKQFGISDFITPPVSPPQYPKTVHKPKLPPSIEGIKPLGCC